MSELDPDCCKMCVWTGWGGNCLCYGELCCAPEAVKNYSRIKSGTMVGGGNVIIIGGPTPSVNQGPLLANNQTSPY